MARNFSSWMVFVFIVLVTVLSLYSMRPGHPWSGDFSMYIMQKDSLVKGDVYDVLSLSSFRNQHSTKIVGPQVYPWGYPAALFLMAKYWGDDIELFKKANVILMGVFLFLVYLYFKNSTSLFSMIIMLAVIGLSPGFFEVKNAVLSDMLAVTLSFISLVTVQMLVRMSSGWKYAAGIICGLSMCAAYFTRAQYIVLPIMAAMVIWFDIVSKSGRVGCVSTVKLIEFHHVVAFIVFSVLFVVGHFAIGVHPSYDSHIAGYNYLSVAMSNFVYYAYAFSLSWGVVNIDPDLFKLAGMSRLVVSAALFLCFFPALVLGVMTMCEKNRQMILIALLGMVIPVLYPWQGGLRLVIFVVPFYLWFVLVGIEQFSRFRTWSVYAKVSRFVLLAMVVFFVSTDIYKCFLYNKDGYVASDGPLSAPSKEVWNYINNNTDPGSTFAFWDPRVLNLFTGRKSASYRQLSDVNPSIIEYVVLAREGDVLGCTSCRECYDEHKMVFSNGNFVVCKTDPSR